MGLLWSIDSAKSESVVLFLGKAEANSNNGKSTFRHSFDPKIGRESSE
jgi:hypothetical protein